LKSFVKEAGLPSDTGAGSNSTVTIESILHEKKTFDLSLNFEKLGVEDGKCEWTVPAPSKPTVLASLPSRSNILSVAAFKLQLPSSSGVRQYVAVSTADRRLHLLDPGSPSFELVHSYTAFQDSPILDILTIGSRYIMIASMSGKLLLYDTVSDQILDERKDHSKYIVRIVCWPDGDSILVASAGWDSKVFLYRIPTGGDTPLIGEPLSTLTLTSIPETLLFVRSPESGSPILLVARRDSTFLYYYSIPQVIDSAFELLGKQNLAPHSNAWVAFTPADVRICPTDPSVVAVATSSTPHMKILILKLLLPPTRAAEPCETAEAEATEPAALTQASQARAELLIANREEAAILINVSTMAPQTAYSTPRLSWRPDGMGLYVSSDDGVVRGVEANSGKLIASMEGHEPGSKLRCLWAGTLETRGSEANGSTGAREVLISGGFDQRLVLWDC
jgi:WD40 repeat protein